MRGKSLLGELLELATVRLLLPYLAVAGAVALLRHLHTRWRRWWPTYGARHRYEAPWHLRRRRIDLRGLAQVAGYGAVGAAIGLVLYLLMFLG